TMSKMAKEGIAYNRFHTTAMCSPTRAALLTGRNQHRVASGQITELANDWDGYSGTIPKSSATVAEVLKDYGYHTVAWGKWHNSHSAHQVPKEWADKYKGKFDDGWDKYRERVYKRAKELGWIPQDAKLTPRPANLASWDSIPEDEKPFQRRLMEVFAGFTEHVDAQVGSIVDD